MYSAIEISLFLIVALLSSHTIAQNDLAIVRQCDQLAGSPMDPQKSSAGVSYDKLDARAAIPVCLQATTADPSNGRVWFELGRAYEKQNSISEALSSYQKATQLGSAAAYNNLGELYRQGKGLPKDDLRAAQFFQKAAELGSIEGRDNLSALNISPASFGEPQKTDNSQTQSNQESSTAQAEVVTQSQPAQANAPTNKSNITFFILIASATLILLITFFAVKRLLKYLRKKSTELAGKSKKKASDLVDSAKIKAEELSSIVQEKSSELNDFAKTQANELKGNFQKEGGFIDGMKELSSQAGNKGSSFAVDIGSNLKSFFQEFSQFEKNLMSQNPNIGFFSKWLTMTVGLFVITTLKQKIILSTIFLIIYFGFGFISGSSSSSNGSAELDSLGRNKTLVCQNYASARQACATAANYSQCMDIKDVNRSPYTGGPMWYGDKESCNADGTIIKYK